MQCAAVCCNVLQCVAVCCSVLQCVAVCCSVLQSSIDIKICSYAVWWLKCDKNHSRVWHDSFTCVTRIIYVCDMTHSHVWHDLFTCVTWLIFICDMTHIHVRHDWCTSVKTISHATWLIYTCDMTYFHVRHGSFSCDVPRTPQNAPSPSKLIHKCDMTHS